MPDQYIHKCFRAEAWAHCESKPHIVSVQNNVTLEPGFETVVIVCNYRNNRCLTTNGSHALFCPWCGVNLREDYAKKGGEDA